MYPSAVNNFNEKKNNAPDREDPEQPHIHHSLETLQNSFHVVSSAHLTLLQESVCSCGKEEKMPECKRMLINLFEKQRKTFPETHYSHACEHRVKIC